MVQCWSDHATPLPGQTFAQGASTQKRKTLVNVASVYCLNLSKGMTLHWRSRPCTHIIDAMFYDCVQRAAQLLHKHLEGQATHLHSSLAELMDQSVIMSWHSYYNLDWEIGTLRLLSQVHTRRQCWDINNMCRVFLLHQSYWFPSMINWCRAVIRLTVHFVRLIVHQQPDPATTQNISRQVFIFISIVQAILHSKLS